jgi:phospholipid/cholesterol/gamma-HCH transport system ATP-binding protein
VRFDRPVLEDVSFEVPTGCLYGLIGPGAAGKSVLLKALVGLVPFSGEVSVLGDSLLGRDDAELMHVRRKVGMLFQNNALFDFMTVAENVGFPLTRLFNLEPDEIARRVTERLARVGLPGFERRMPAGLSGGQKKRVGVARATISNAEVVLYDEPAAGLDPVSSQKLFDLLREEQQRRNATVIMVSSDLDRLLTVTDRVGMLLRGRLIFDGTTDEARASNEPHVRQFVHGLVEGPL